MRKSKLEQGIRDMRRLAGYFDELGQTLLASNFRREADSFESGLPRREFSDRCRFIHSSLDDGPGRAPDLYFALPSGQPDLEKTENYQNLINEVRSFARAGILSRFSL